MNIKLGNLKRGEYRELTAEELDGLKKLLCGSTNLPMSEVVKLREAEKDRKPERKQKPDGRAQKPGADRKTERPEAFKEGHRIFRTAPKRYPEPAGRVKAEADSHKE